MIDRYNYLRTNEFLEYLGEVKGLKETSVTRYKHHLRHLVKWADDTRLFNVMNKRPTFLIYVRKLVNEQDHDLSLETKSRIIETAKRFFEWAKLHCETDFRKVPPSWIDTIQMPKSGSPQNENVHISLGEIFQIARLQFAEHDLVMQRDQAAAVMLFLSGMRAGAFASAPIRAFALEKNLVYQYPELGVKTKNGKRAATSLLPIPELTEIVKVWDRRVRSVRPFTTPWYAPIMNEWGEQSFSIEAVGKNRGAALNKRLRILLKAAGLPYKSAHKFRHGFAVYGRQHAKDMEAYKAVSHNLMHHDLSITDGIYAPMGDTEAGAQIARLTQAASTTPNGDVAADYNGLSRKELEKKVLEDMLRRLKDE